MMIMMVMIISMSWLQKVVHPGGRGRGRGGRAAGQAGQRSRQDGVEVSAAAAWWGFAQPATRAAHLINASGGDLQLFFFIIFCFIFDLFLNYYILELYLTHICSFSKSVDIFCCW